MSDPRRVLLVGATGLIGRSVIEQAPSVPGISLVALARREIRLPRGARMEMLLADPADWAGAVAAIQPDAVICALGTTRAKAGSEDAFREVDERLVLAVARAAKDAGASHFCTVSSVGADAGSKSFYLRVKGEVEQALQAMKWHRLDILRPGLLRGKRDNDRRALERLGIAAAPVTNLFLQGGNRKYRAIAAETVATAALQCVREKARGKFVHDNDAIQRSAARLERRLEEA